MAQRTVKVAVVGSGLAGLTSAHLLSVAKPRNEDVDVEVHLFEKADSLGLDAYSVSVEVPNVKTGKRSEWRVDVPMRSFQGGYYPRLMAFYKHLGISYLQRDFSYSFSLLRTSTAPDGSLEQNTTTTFIYDGQSGRKGISIPSTIRHKLQRGSMSRNLLTYISFMTTTALLAFNYLRAIFLSTPWFRTATSATETFEEWTAYNTPRGAIARWLGLHKSWERYAVEVLIPLFSAVCTAPEEDIWQHPVEEFLDYMWLTFGTHHYVVTGGVRKAAERLARDVRHVHLGAPIDSLTPDPCDPSRVSITANGTTHHGFAHVVFATQANTAALLLKGYAKSLPSDSPTRVAVEDQVEHLSKFQYSKNLVVNHTDESLLPDSPSDIRDLNLVCWDPSSALASKRAIASETVNGLCLPHSYAMATHVIPRPVGVSADAIPVYQTTNPTRAIAKEKVLSVARMERAVLTPAAKEARRAFCEEVPAARPWWACPAQAPTRLGCAQGAGALTGMSAGPGVWVCGSYAHVGIPLLEGCVVSARNVTEGIFTCERLDVEKQPW